MKSFKELRTAIKNNVPLIWDDPDPIKGNDYTITFVEDLKGLSDPYDPILIQYGSGSEAQVFLNEIILK